MIRLACGMAVVMFLLVNAASGWSQQRYLYSPTAVGVDVKAQGKDAVLVEEVSVLKGDTLYGISRKFSGHGSYYPQILLFNDIKDPNKIYPGNVFKIPVSRNAESPHEAHIPLKNGTAAVTGGEAALRRAEAASVKKTVPVSLSATSAKKQASGEKKHAATAGASDAAAGQKLFERAVKAYRQDDYRTALDLFDRYLAENQASPLAADASLYKAECYLKLSSQN